MAATSSRASVLMLLTAAQAAASVVQQGFGSLAPFLIKEFGLSHAQVGLSFSIILGGAVFTTALAGVVVDRFGERKMILWSGVGMGAALVMSSAVANFTWLLFWLLIFGVGYSSSTPAGGRAILVWFTRDRGFAMGVRQTGVSIGGFIGALYLPAAALAGGYRFALLTAGIMCAAVCACAALLYQEAGDIRPPTISTRALLRSTLALVKDPRLIATTLSCMILMCSQQAVLSFMVTAMGSQLGVQIAVAALALSFVQLGAIAGRMFWGWVSDRFFGGDRMIVMVVLCVVVAGSTIMLSYVRPGFVVIAYALALVFGFSGASWNGLFATVLSEVAGPHLAGSALGVGLTFIFLTAFVWPPFYGRIVDMHGFAFAWRVLSVIALTGIPMALIARAFIRADPPARHT